MMSFIFMMFTTLNIDMFTRNVCSRLVYTVTMLNILWSTSRNRAVMV